MITTPLIEQYPRPLPRQPDSLFRKWVSAHQDEASRTNADLIDVKESSQILNADIDELEEIGRKYGYLGKRRLRGREEYRSYLLGLSSAFNGRGTEEGMQFAIAASVLSGDPDSVEIYEINIHDRTYGVNLSDWQSHHVKVVDEIAGLADPVLSRRGGSIGYQYGTQALTVSSDPRVIRTDVMAPAEPAVVSSSDFSYEITNTDGLGTEKLDGDDELGPSNNDPLVDDNEGSFDPEGYNEGGYGDGTYNN